MARKNAMSVYEYPVQRFDAHAELDRYGFQPYDVHKILDQARFRGESQETTSKIPAILIGLTGLGALGAAVYFATRTPVSQPVVAKPRIAPMPKSSPKAPAPKPRGGGGGASQFKVGQHVEAQWTDGQWYGAKVVAVNGNQHTVAWDDGTAPSVAPVRVAAMTQMVETHSQASSQSTQYVAPGNAPPRPDHYDQPQSEVDEATLTRTKAMATCFMKGGDQVDQDGNCFKGDVKIG